MRHHVLQTYRLRLQVAFAVVYQWNVTVHHCFGIADVDHWFNSYVVVVWLYPSGIAVVIDRTNASAVVDDPRCGWGCIVEFRLLNPLGHTSGLLYLVLWVEFPCVRVKDMVFVGS